MLRSQQLGARLIVRQALHRPSLRPRPPSSLPVGRRCALSTSGVAAVPPPSAAGAAAIPKPAVEYNVRPIAYWLLGTASLVAGMVTVGGITRLTKSGLSMTDWRIQGSLPPMNEEEWEREFARYKTFPEYIQRRHMTLDEFKFIYFWEYGHRMMGRFIGLAYGLPLAYFVARGRVPPSLRARLATLFALGGGQGLIGWWMVKSGLEMDPNQRKEIRVSPYRLAVHLGMAFTTFTLLVWTGLDLLQPPAEQLRKLAASISPSALARVKSVRSLALASTGLLGVTIVSGAFVAGNDAGRAFNTFPKMGDEWVPSEILEMTPTYRNFFENTATVQFDHRVLALSTASAIAATYAAARRGTVWAALPPNARLALNATAAMAATQVSLGISTLLLYVPIPLAAAHQAGSMVLLTTLAWSLQSLRFAKFANVAKLAPQAVKAVVR